MKKGEKEGHIHQHWHRKVKKGELEREKKVTQEGASHGYCCN